MSRVLLVGALIFGSAVVPFAPPANACGLKLTVAATKVGKPIAPSQHPSRILILGDAPSSVTRALKRAGHVVESADTVDEVRKREFDVVLVSDKDDVPKAKDTWTDAQVMAMKSRTNSNLEMVESTIGRKPIDTERGRTAIASGPSTEESRKQVDSGQGSDDERPVVAAADTPKEERREEKPVVEEETLVERPVTNDGTSSKPIVKAEKKEEPKPVVREKPEPKEEPILAARVDPPVRREPKPVLTKSTRTIPQPEEEEEEAEETGAAQGPKSLRFGLASVRLSARAKRGLDKHAAYLRAHPDVSVHITGHTDEIGSEDVNMILSRARSDNAKTYLSRKGIAESRITAEAFGESNPPFPPASSAKNRCVVIKIGE